MCLFADQIQFTVRCYNSMLHRWSGVRPAAVGVLVVLEVLKAVLQIILTIEF